MSDTNSESKTEAAPVKKSPLQLRKELQAAQSSHRAAKEKRPDPSGETGGGAKDAPVAKPMRSSASKQGG